MCEIRYHNKRFEIVVSKIFCVFKIRSPASLRKFRGNENFSNHDIFTIFVNLAFLPRLLPGIEHALVLCIAVCFPKKGHVIQITCHSGISSVSLASQTHFRKKGKSLVNCGYKPVWSNHIAVFCHIMHYITV